MALCVFEDNKFIQLLHVKHALIYLPIHVFSRIRNLFYDSGKSAGKREKSTREKEFKKSGKTFP